MLTMIGSYHSRKKDRNKKVGNLPRIIKETKEQEEEIGWKTEAKKVVMPRAEKVEVEPHFSPKFINPD